MVLTEKLRRSATLSFAALLFLASSVPLLTRQTASAATLLGQRKITMSSSAPGNTPGGAGTGLLYEVDFDIATTGTLQGVVVTFCENTPIIEDTSCVRPAGFSLVGATAIAPATAGDIDPSGWTESLEDHASSAGDANTLTLADNTGVSATAGQTVRFVINGVTNPNAVNGSFYARIYTYSTAAAATGYTLANPNVVAAAVDAGGIALSTAQQITITSKVQERITFCVYTDDTYVPVTDNTCVGKTYSPISLGDLNGVLSDQGPYVDKTAHYSITTNAAFNAVINMKGDTLKNGTQDIDAIPTATVEASNPGQEQFGLCTYELDGAGLTPAPTYDGAQAYTVPSAGTGAGCAATSQTSGTGATGGAGGASFAFDTNALTGTMSTYGMTIGTKLPGDYSTGKLAFLGNISAVTQPGIYTTTLTFIATGTY